MPSAQRTVFINRPIEEVFAFFTDVANETKWRAQVKELSAPGPLAVGVRVHQVVEGPGHRGIPADFEVTDFAPPERYAFRVVAGPVRPVGVYLFTADGDGATTVVFSLTAELSGVKKIVMSRPVQRSMDGEMDALDGAKRLIEAM